MFKNNSPVEISAAGRKRRYKIGIISTITTILVVLAIILANYFIDYLTTRFILQVDMTSNDLYEITDDTKDVLLKLSEPITITVLADETTYESSDILNPLREIMYRYASLSQGMLSVEFVNPNVNPTLTAKFDVLGDVKSNDIIIESSKRFKKYEPSNLYELYTDSDSGSTYITGLRAEQRLTSGILYVLAEKVPQAAYVTGHGETTNLDEMDSLLATGNYEVTSINLGLEGVTIDRQIDMLIISQPLYDFSDEEIAKMDDWMAATGGKNIIVTYSTQTPQLENLERWFEEWGVTFSNEVIMDYSQCLAGYPTYIIPNVNSFEGLTDNLNGSMSIAIPGARVMNTLFEEDNWRWTKVLLESSSKSYSKDLGETIESFDQTSDDSIGPFPMLVLAGQTTADNLDYSFNYILFANAGMLSDSVLSVDNLQNSSYFLAALNYMTQDSEDAVLIEPKTYESSTLVIEGWQSTFLFWLLIIIIPVGIFGSGLVIWLRRRHM